MSKGADALFSDNWLDLHGNEPVTVQLLNTVGLSGLTAGEILERLDIAYYCSTN